jgi:hypothetical protein
MTRMKKPAKQLLLRIEMVRDLGPLRACAACLVLAACSYAKPPPVDAKVHDAAVDAAHQDANPPNTR